MSSREREGGFTLIEVLAAVLIVGIFVPMMLMGIGAASRDLARARSEVEASELALQRIDELRSQIAAGEELRDGVESGTFPDSEVRWEVRVEPLVLPLPAGFQGEVAPSPLFAMPDAGRGRPPEPIARRISVRVMLRPDQESDDSDVDAFVFYAVEPGSVPGAGGLSTRDLPDDLSDAIPENLREELR